MLKVLEFNDTQSVGLGGNVQKETQKSFNLDELNKKKLLSRPESAFYIGVCPSTMHHIIHSEGFPAMVRIGCRVFVNRTVLDQWIDEQTGKA